MKSVQTNIYKRTHRNGSVSWMVRWKSPKTGRWRARTAGKSETEASLIEAQIRQELARGTDPDQIDAESAHHLTVADIVKVFYGHSRFLGGTPRWRKDAREKIDNDIVPKLGKKFFSELDQDTIFKFYLGLRQREISNATIDKYHGLLRIIGDVFKKKSGINPIREIEGFRKQFPKQPPTRDINFMTSEEIEQLDVELFTSTSKLLRPFAIFLVESGLRRSEAYLLKWTDVDLKGKFIHIRKTKHGKARTIPLESKAWRAIASLKGNGAFVFTTDEGERYHLDSLLRPLQRAARRAGIDRRIDLHTLRHSFGSNKIRAGWGLKKVSMLLGHADISTTANIYTHLLDGDLRVRDESRLDFDKRPGNLDIQSERNTDEKMASMVAQTLTSVLGNTAEGQLALFGLMKKVSEESRSLQANSLKLSDSDEFATPMLRTAPGSFVAEATPTASLSDLCLDSLALSDLKMEPMNGIEPATYALRKRCSTN
jgi:integrase